MKRESSFESSSTNKIIAEKKPMSTANKEEKQKT